MFYNWGWCYTKLDRSIVIGLRIMLLDYRDWFGLVHFGDAVHFVHSGVQCHCGYH